MSRRPQDALELLREGNQRFAAGSPQHRFTPDELHHVAGVQNPWAVIVGCSDSRVPVEMIFDVGVGDLFVVRTAGHVLAEASVASVRFAAEKLGCHLIVVLGHEDCGAVAAALAGDAPDWLGPIVSHIDIAHVDESRAPEGAEDMRLAAAVDDHVRDTVALLQSMASEFDTGEPVAVEGAAYRLSTGRVHWLGSPPE